MYLRCSFSAGQTFLAPKFHRIKNELPGKMNNLFPNSSFLPPMKYTACGVFATGEWMDGCSIAVSAESPKKPRDLT